MAVSDTDTLEHWVIYDKPSDYPNQVVVRRYLIRPGSIEARPERWLCTTVREARQVVEAQYPGAYCIGRQPDDDPVIVEVWV